MDDEPNHHTRKGKCTPPDKTMVVSDNTASLTEASMCSEEEGEESSSSSTLMTTDTANAHTVVIPSSSSVTTAMQRRRRRQDDDDDDDESLFLLQRNVVRYQAFVFAMVSTSSLGIFLFLCLDLTALVALMVFVGSTIILCYMGYRVLVFEWNHLLSNRGIGDFLPSAVYQQLTTTSVHEWMMDGSFFVEHRYLLLYFIPGLTRDQLDSYLERLPTRHQYVLTRPGLGQFFGRHFMRFVMGQRRYDDLLLEDERETEIIEHNGTSRRLFEEEEETTRTTTTNNNNEDENNLEAAVVDDTTMTTTTRRSESIDDGGGSRRRGGGVNGNHSPTTSVPIDLDSPKAEQQHSRQEVIVPPPQPVSTDPADVPEEELERQYNEESDILTDAVAAMTTSYSTMITDAATGYVVRAVEYVTPPVVRSGLTLSVGALSIGLWGWSLGVYHFHTTTTTRPRLQLPTSRTLWSTAIFGAGSAAAMLVVRCVARSVVKYERKKSSDSQSTDSSEDRSK